jgi:hypothetical protein
MVLGVGRVHPRGEADPAYDGLFYRADEMQTLAESLPGKPLLIEHLQDHPVGQVQRAWVSRDGGLLCTFQTHGGTFAGLLAQNLLRDGLATDLSLGHRVKVDASAHRVVSKDALEVSLVERGARPGTHVLGVGEATHQKNAGYILKPCGSSWTTTESEPTMSSDPTAPPPTQQAPASLAAPAVNETNVMQELLQQMQSQQESHGQLQAQLDSVMKQLGEEKAHSERLGRVQKEQRESVINSTLKDYVASMITSFGDRLKPHSEELQHMLEGMGKSEESKPLIDLLSCAASARADSVTKLEKAYQDAKKVATERDAYKAQVAHLRAPALEKPGERFVGGGGGSTGTSTTTTTAAAPPAAKRARGNEWTPSMTAKSYPRGMKPLRQQRDGMQLRNPQFWAALRGSGRVGSGMPTFDEPNLVGKDYHDDHRRPSSIPRAAP